MALGTLKDHVTFGDILSDLFWTSVQTSAVVAPMSGAGLCFDFGLKTIVKSIVKA